jgi:hypothetical protein
MGYEWLEKFNPMKVHWGVKWMAIPYGSSTVVVQGLLSELHAGQVLQVYQLQGQDSEAQSAVELDNSGLLPKIADLLQNYADVFATKVEFPPPRSCSHSIPLVPGARPVNVKPYRYALVLKDEIKKQVHEMLQSGLIQQSNNPFSSPILLVKKKDNTYRFCVDYRHLNAITTKGKYLVPIIDEFLDELRGAS